MSKSKLDTKIFLTYGGTRGTTAHLATTANGYHQPVGELYLYEQYRAALERVEELSAELERAAMVQDYHVTIADFEAGAGRV